MSPWLAISLAGVTAILVRLDARAARPYFAYGELVPGTGISQAALRGEESAVRLGLIRRFGYAFLLGVLLAYVFSFEILDVVLAGGAVGMLLIWPVAIEGMPVWLAPKRLLIGLYVGVVAALGALAALGYLFVDVVAAGDLAGWLAREALQVLASVIVAALALTLIQRLTRLAK